MTPSEPTRTAEERLRAASKRVAEIALMLGDLEKTHELLAAVNELRDADALVRSAGRVYRDGESSLHADMEALRDEGLRPALEAVARLTAERDQLKGQIELLNAAVEGALRRAERAEDALKGRS